MRIFLSLTPEQKTDDLNRLACVIAGVNTDSLQGRERLAVVICLDTSAGAQIILFNFSGAVALIQETGHRLQLNAGISDFLFYSKSAYFEREKNR